MMFALFFPLSLGAESTYNFYFYDNDQEKIAKEKENEEKKELEKKKEEPGEDLDKKEELQGKKEENEGNSSFAAKGLKTLFGSKKYFAIGYDLHSYGFRESHIYGQSVTARFKVLPLIAFELGFPVSNHSELGDTVYRFGGRLDLDFLPSLPLFLSGGVLRMGSGKDHGNPYLAVGTKLNLIEYLSLEGSVGVTHRPLHVIGELKPISTSPYLVKVSTVNVNEFRQRSSNRDPFFVVGLSYELF